MPGDRPPSARPAAAPASAWTPQRPGEILIPAPMPIGAYATPTSSHIEHPRRIPSWGQLGWAHPGQIPPSTPPQSAIPTPATSSAAETFSEQFGWTQDVSDIGWTYPSALLLVQDGTLHVIGQDGTLHVVGEDGTLYFAGPDPAYGRPPATLMGPTGPHLAVSASSAIGGALSERYGVPSPPPPPQEMGWDRGKPRECLQPQQDHPHVHQPLLRLSPTATAPPHLSPADFATSDEGSDSTAEDMTRYFGSPTPTHVAPSVVFPVTASRTAPVCGVSWASQSRGDNTNPKSCKAFSERPSMAVPALPPMRASTTQGAARSKRARAKVSRTLARDARASDGSSVNLPGCHRKIVCRVHPAIRPFREWAMLRCVSRCHATRADFSGTSAIFTVKSLIASVRV